MGRHGSEPSQRKQSDVFEEAAGCYSKGSGGERANRHEFESARRLRKAAIRGNCLRDCGMVGQKRKMILQADITDRRLAPGGVDPQDQLPAGTNVVGGVWDRSDQ